MLINLDGSNTEMPEKIKKVVAKNTASRRLTFYKRLSNKDVYVLFLEVKFLTLLFHSKLLRVWLFSFVFEIEMKIK